MANPVCLTFPYLFDGVMNKLIPFVVYPKGHKSLSNPEWNQLVQNFFGLSVTDKPLNGGCRT